MPCIAIRNEASACDCGAGAAQPGVIVLVGKQSGYLIIPLLQGFEWFDEGLQRSMKARGWQTLTRPESMIMIHVVQDMIRPSEIARSLGLTRQAVHRTIGQICEKGLFELQPDPNDGRGSIIVLTEQGAAMRRDAQFIVGSIHKVLEQRLGSKAFANLLRLLESDWGPVAEIDAAEQPPV